MAAIGGPIESVTINRRLFAVAADADGQRKLGGAENEFQSNGDYATGRIIKNIVGWSVGSLTISVDDDNDDHEFLQEICDSNDFYPCLVTFANGQSYQGTGTITGELMYSGKNSTVTAKFEGPGKLTRQ